MSELPRGWVELQLKEITKIGGGSVNPKDYPNEIFELYSVPSFSEGHPEIISGAEIGSSKQIVQNDDVLLCKIVPHIRRVWTVGKQGEYRQIASGEWIVYRNHYCEPGFLKFALSENSFRQKFLGTVSGVGGSLMRASPKSVAEFHIPLPPLAEQKRIVAKLEALATKSARARTDLARIDTLVTRYKQAVLSKAFSGELTKAQEIETRNEVSVGDITAELDQGWSPKCERVPATEDGQWAVITTTSIQPISFDPQENKALPDHLEPRQKLQIRVGDILITRAGPRVRCGVCCYVAGTRSNLMLCDKAYRLRLNESFDPEFFVYLMNSPDLLSEIERMKTGGNDSGLNLTQARFKSLKVPLWSMNTQKRCVLVIKDQFEKIDRLAAEAKRALELVGKLDEAILAKAFKGQLVPQDPKDEPASVLLERIKAERAAAPKEKRGRGKKV